MDAGEAGSFCCSGCAGAHALIQELGLGRYYELRDGNLTDPALVGAADYGVLAGTDFLRDFGRALTDGRVEVRLHLEGLHCYGCVWLCETAARRLAPTAEISVSLATGVARLAFVPGTVPLAELGQLFARLGHKPTALRWDQVATLDSAMLRLGTAIFCALNTMSFALVDYFAEPGTVDPGLATLLRSLSWALATLSLAYAAGPLLRAGAAALVRGRPGVDTGVAVALTAAYLYSTGHVWVGGTVYFDSVTAIIALLLTGRFLQRRLLLSVESLLTGAGSGVPAFVRRVGPDGDAPMALEEVRRGDVIRVLPGETVPLAGHVMAGVGEVSLEQLTGEAGPVAVAIGDRLRAGSLNLSQALTLRAAEDGYRCYLAEAQRTTQRLLAGKGRLATLSDRLAGNFFWLSAAVAVSTFVYAWLHLGEAAAVQRGMAVLLVACPCVFGFAAPLAFATCGARGLRAGVAFRTQTAVEALATTRTMVLDKTGTLTLGGPVVIKALEPAGEVAAVSPGTLRALLTAAAGASSHHAAQAVGRWAVATLPPGPPALETLVVETLGEGVTVDGGGHRLRLGRRAFAGAADAAVGAVFAVVDGATVRAFELSDQVRPEAPAVVACLKRLGLVLQMMSGDREEPVQALAARLGVPAVAELTPCGKALALGKAARQGTVAMVGNGFNDALAMGKAHVGVAVESAGPAAKAAADVTLLRPGLEPLVGAVRLARGAVGAVYRAFAFAAAYNLAAMALAISGHVSPVVAALLMPANSLAVTLIATRWRAGGRP